MRRYWIVFIVAVALLALSLAAPAAAKKGGHPGPPSGSGLEVTVTVDNFAWANSAGDKIPFEITVTNTGSDPLTVDTVTFEEIPTPLPTDPLGKNESWSTTYVYTVTADDLLGLPLQEQSELVAGTVTVKAGDLEDSAPATTTASPVRSCEYGGSGILSLEHKADYTVCSALFEDAASYWMITATGPPRTGKGNKRSGDVFLTMRDGVPGNWCTVVPIDSGNWDGGVYEGSQTGWETTTIDGRKQLTRFMFFPPFTAIDNVPDGTCLGGGAGGDTITTRNGENRLFYLAYRGAVVATPCPGGVVLDNERLTCLP
jgi:hypothetical protein